MESLSLRDTKIIFVYFKIMVLAGLALVSIFLLAGTISNFHIPTDRLIILILLLILYYFINYSSRKFVTTVSVSDNPNSWMIETQPYGEFDSESILIRREDVVSLKEYCIFVINIRVLNIGKREFRFIPKKRSFSWSTWYRKKADVEF